MARGSPCHGVVKLDYPYEYEMYLYELLAKFPHNASSFSFNVIL